jgi:NAD(P)-dependent dehydrogenase (short-subunit alcohol dehydrogenase family)
MTRTRAAGGRFDGQVAVVTGAGSGIGEASARRLGSEGAAVLVADIDPASAERVASLIASDGGRAVAHAVDVSREDEVAAMIARAVDEWGRLDALHNNAAAGGRTSTAGDGRVGDLDAEFFMRRIEVNVLGPMLGTKHALPHMLAAGYGAIVNTSSGAAAMAAPDGMTAYGASKAALESLTRSTAVQYGKRGIRCNALAPGTTRVPGGRPTDSRERLEIVRQTMPLQEIATPEEQAAIVAFLLSVDARQITGQVIQAGGGGNVVSAQAAVMAYAESIGAFPDPANAH